jgi:hypothetical protein
MATYRLTAMITTDTKAPRRGEAERQRFAMRKMLADRGVSLRDLRSVCVVRVK